SSTVFPSIPAPPLLALTPHIACFRFPHSQISSIIRSVLAGLSYSCAASSDSVSPDLPSPASPGRPDREFASVFCRLSLLRFTTYLPLLSRSGLRSSFPV